MSEEKQNCFMEKKVERNQSVAQRRKIKYEKNKI
jgi:hypothetical protein